MEGDQLDFEDPSSSLEKTDSTSQSPTMCPVVLEVAEQELIIEESAPTTDSDEIGIANIEINNVFSLHLVDETCTDQDLYSDESPLPGGWVNDEWTDASCEHEDASSVNGVVVCKIIWLYFFFFFFFLHISIISYLHKTLF
jgi:hypothetical protein